MLRHLLHHHMLFVASAAVLLAAQFAPPAGAAGIATRPVHARAPQAPVHRRQSRSHPTVRPLAHRSALHHNQRSRAHPAPAAHTKQRPHTTHSTTASGACSSPHSYVLMTQALTVVGTNIQVRYHNFSATCTAQLGIATYDSLGQGLNNQKLYASQETMLGPGHNATLAAALPPCHWQADTFYGPVLTPPYYGIQLFDFEFGGHDCATATPTGTSTAAATNTPTPTSTLGIGGGNSTNTPTPTNTALSTNTSTPTPTSTSSSSVATTTPTPTSTLGIGGSNSTNTPTPSSTNTPAGTATIGIGGTGSGTNTPTATPSSTSTVAIGGVGSGTSTPTPTATSASGSGTFDTFISPLTATIGTATFAEAATGAELPPGASATIAGSVGFTVYDLRGNNQGWVAYLSCTGATSGQPCITSSLAPSGNGAQIMANQVAISGLAAVSLTPLFGQSFGPGVAINSSGKTLDTMQPVAGECPVEGIGQGIYNVSVPLSATLTGLQTEYLTLPVSWTGNLDLTIVEGPAASGVPPSGC